jgi:hypothetical protein
MHFAEVHLLHLRRFTAIINGVKAMMLQVAFIQFIAWLPVISLIKKAGKRNRHTARPG